MNAPQNNLLATGQSVSTALETITATNVPAALTAAHVALNTTLGNIRNHAATQALPITGKTRDRDAVFAAAADATLVIAGLVLSYAKNQKLGDLAAKVDLTASQLARGRFDTRVQLMQQVHDAAAGVVGQLADFEVTAATLTDLQTKIDAASALLTSPRSTIVARRVATQNLAEGFGQLEDLLHQIDPLIKARCLTDPDSYKLDQAARVVIDRPGAPSQPEPTPAPASSAPPVNAPAAPTAGVTPIAR
jgi:hypothetical protein